MTEEFARFCKGSNITKEFVPFAWMVWRRAQLSVLISTMKILESKNHDEAKAKEIKQMEMIIRFIDNGCVCDPKSWPGDGWIPPCDLFDNPDHTDICKKCGHGIDCHKDRKMPPEDEHDR